jgi:type I restriction enzyme M protein
VVRLMSRLLIEPDREKLQEPHLIRKFYDPCCGTGGMLTIAKDYVQSFNPRARIYLYGQEVNPETYAVCKSDLYMKDPTGRDAEKIKRGSTLSEDQHPEETFAYQLANPPYGKNWQGDSKAVRREEKRGHAGRFGAGTPRISDGQLLFLQHMLSHMQSPEDGGGRIAIIMNGSPLFTGDAGSGESEIRRWILENDWLEALVALPEQLFYNTGIATYVWILSNRKPEARRGKVQLIDATELWAPMRKSLGDKRRQLEEKHIQEIVDLSRGKIENGRVKVFETAEFGFRKIRVERPLRMNFQATPERIEHLKEERAFQKIVQSRKRDPEKKAREVVEGKAKQEAILEMLAEMEARVYRDVETFREVFKRAAEERGIQLYAATRDAIVDALGVKDETAEIVLDRQGRPEPDTDLRDYENVPLTEDVEDYFQREVQPYVPDAWIDEDYTDEKDGRVGRVGYEINFNRYFYEYEPPRPLAEIEAEINQLQGEILSLLNEVTTDGENTIKSENCS